MTQRREPTISNLSLDGTEPARRVQARGASLLDDERSIEPADSKGSKLTFIALLLSFIGVAVGAYAATQVHQGSKALLIAEARVLQAEARISELEQKLAVADGESTQSLTVLQVQVKDNMSEIRKLWGVAYDRNRKAISVLEKELKRVGSSLTQFEVVAKEERGQLAASLDRMKSDLSVLADVQEAGQSVLLDAKIATKEQVKKMAGMQSQVKRIEERLSIRMVKTEESIKAIDAFRLQVNRDLLSLKEWTRQSAN